MGIAEDLKIIRVIEKLNRVINRSSLASKFVSLFYGELERNGNFIYCNAGHVPTLFVNRAGFTPLTKGGPVLGPSPGARYERGYIEMEVGDLLIYYSDGIVEAHAPDDVEFGVQRLQDVVRLHRAAPAREITDAIFAAVEAYAPHDPLRDDQTVVVVRRAAEVD
jgi:sigma-B regulation protein RsbU (phosphoserine phosphatase)